MTAVADDLEVFTGFPPHALNVYFSSGVLIDTGTRFTGRRLLRELAGRDVEAVSLTHGHPDHAGSVRRLCERFGIPLWCPEKEAEAVTAGAWATMLPDNTASKLFRMAYAGRPHPVSRRLRDGDKVGGFVVVDTPGHSPGHVSYWREADRVLIVGDAIFAQDTWGRRGLQEAPAVWTVDQRTNRDSIRRLAALEPAAMFFNHGPALHDMDQLRRLVDSLPG